MQEDFGVHAIELALCTGPDVTARPHYYEGLPERSSLTGLPTWIGMLMKNPTSARETVYLLSGPQGSGKSELGKALVRHRGCGIYVSLRDALGASQQPSDVRDTILEYLGCKLNG